MYRIAIMKIWSNHKLFCFWIASMAVWNQYSYDLEFTAETRYCWSRGPKLLLTWPWGSCPMPPSPDFVHHLLAHNQVLELAVQVTKMCYLADLATVTLSAVIMIDFRHVSDLASKLSMIKIKLHDEICVERQINRASHKQEWELMVYKGLWSVRQIRYE